MKRSGPARALSVALALGLTGCAGCERLEDLLQDAGGGGVVENGGPGPSDAGMKPVVDGGAPVISYVADEPCVEAEAEFADAGQHPAVVYPLCVGIRRMTGLLQVDGRASPAPASIELAGDGFQSEQVVQTGADGQYEVRALKSRYLSVLLHPDELGPSHAGPLDQGGVDLQEDRTKDLTLKSHKLVGTATFGGQTWSLANGNSALRLDARGVGTTLMQQNASPNGPGGYGMRFIEGKSTLFLSVPIPALGETELSRIPVGQVDLFQDHALNIAIPSSVLSGTLRVNGAPVPDRRAGPDFQFSLLKNGQDQALTRSEGGQEEFRGVVPKGTYSVYLDVLEGQSPELPAIIYGQRIADPLDLNQDQHLTIDLPMRKVEGILLLDGVPPAPRPFDTWLMYAYLGSGSPTPGAVEYYKLPINGAGFKIFMLPGVHYTAVYVDEYLDPVMAKGWRLVTTSLVVQTDISFPIDIPTATLQGTLAIDGAPASAPERVGTLTFSSTTERYEKAIFTQDGRFTVRVPKGIYNVNFRIDPEAYPDHAVGNWKLASNLDLTQDQSVDFHYDTQEIAGPLRVDGVNVPDSLGLGLEVGVRLDQMDGTARLTKGLTGGRSDYRFRAPKGRWAVYFEIAPGGIPDVAYGEAPLGRRLDVP